MIILLFAFCRTHRTEVNNSPAQMAPKDSIVFISMKMWHDSLQQSNHIEVMEVLTKPGSLKRQLTNNSMRENYLKCITLNKTGMRDSFLIEHPLYKDVEAIGENNQLSMKRLNLKEAQFFVRFQKKKYTTLVIKENASLMQLRDSEIQVIKF
ncbi:MAG TPA: hypothetical protein VFG54_07455 [Prolixibacteraceae bacterium]|nr:hypothetical protein [Prolixibacteraceae bacterium]